MGWSRKASLSNILVASKISRNARELAEVCKDKEGQFKDAAKNCSNHARGFWLVTTTSRQ
jgi:hypothetical protein